MPTQREAWLVDLDDAGARTEGDLCNRHATALVLPRGWALHDERTRVEVEPDELPVPRRSTRPRRRPLVAVPARRPFRQPELELELSLLRETAPGAREDEHDTDALIEASDTVIEVETAIVLEPEPEASVDLAFEAAPEAEPEPEAEIEDEVELESEVDVDEEGDEAEPESEEAIELEAEAAEPTPPETPPAAKATPSSPLPTPEGLADVLDARTPLLRRAFQNVWPFEESSDDD